ncbi:hypothetical protein POM88_051096 [Heracleum sosnowskyi]|uniref:DUF7086 domain-containing protein n=1 Tax=Heracleum sosnowskyi TaxID=360622 RepID=A0AAD8M0Y9_9APIA|nr:hypothetical protein POM88_051096 [Heracleum sosnowskyi]
MEPRHPHRPTPPTTIPPPSPPPPVISSPPLPRSFEFNPFLTPNTNTSPPYQPDLSFHIPPLFSPDHSIPTFINPSSQPPSFHDPTNLYFSPPPIDPFSSTYLHPPPPSQPLSYEDYIIFENSRLKSLNPNQEGSSFSSTFPPLQNLENYPNFLVNMTSNEFHQLLPTYLEEAEIPLRPASPQVLEPTGANQPPLPAPPQLSPWLEEAKATVKNLNILFQEHHYSITGEMKCRHCRRTYNMSFDLVEKLEDLRKYVKANKAQLKKEIATQEWAVPGGVSCKMCPGGSAFPVIPSEKKKIDWLLFFLTQTIGNLTVNHLQYFLKHQPINYHKVVNKSSIVYLVYKRIYDQLGEAWPIQD